MYPPPGEQKEGTVWSQGCRVSLSALPLRAYQSLLSGHHWVKQTAGGWGEERGVGEWGTQGKEMGLEKSLLGPLQKGGTLRLEDSGPQKEQVGQPGV